MWNKLTSCREAVGVLEKLVADFPKVQEYQEKLANTYFDLGNVFKDAGRSDGAEEAYRSAEAIRPEVVTEEKESSRLRSFCGFFIRQKCKWKNVLSNRTD